MNYIRTLAVLLIFLTIPGSVLGSRLEDKVRQHQFPNGLTLLVMERPESPTVDAYVTLGVGSVHENSKNRGVAHLLEHMLFKGTKTVGTKDYAKEKPLLDRIEAVGSQIDRLKHRPTASEPILHELRSELKALQKEHQKLVVKDEFSKIYSRNGGVGFNAFTSRDLTTYLVSLPSNKLELWATLESDRMRNPVLREFYTEREVVHEERRRSYETNPGGLMFEQLLATAFTMHPYRNPIIGWHSDIDHLTLEETRKFLKDYYAPRNTVIALVGDVGFEEAVALIDRHFSDIAPGIPVPPVEEREPPQKGERRLHITFDAQPRLMMAFHKPTLPERDDYVFDLINMLLSSGRSSRLYRSLVLEQGIASSVQTYVTPGSRYNNLFVVSATPRHPHSLETLEKALLEELDKLANGRVNPKELTRVRNQLATDQLRRLRSNKGLAQMLTYFQSVAGDWRYLASYQEAIADIGPEEIQQVARKYLVPTNRTVLTLSKEEKDS